MRQFGFRLSAFGSRNGRRRDIVHALFVGVVATVMLEGCFPSAPRFTTEAAASSTRSHSGAAQTTSANVGDTFEGIASYYGDEFNGRKTSSGEIFDMNKMTCAHQTLPFGTLLHVVNLDNGKSCDVTVNDRGPFAHDRIIDLSFAAARAIGMIGPGTARVRLEVVR